MLSGNRNFEGRVSPDVQANYLASPPLVVAYALAGRMDFDMASEPLGNDKAGKPVFLRDIWPTPQEIESTVRANVTSSSQGTRIDDLYTSIPSLGTATGSGTVAPGGGLNFQVVAKINTTSGVGAQALAGVNATNGILGQAISTAAANGIPVHISGTTSNPVIQADLSKLLEKNAGNILKQQILGNGNQKPNPGALLNNLFHH